MTFSHYPNQYVSVVTLVHVSVCKPIKCHLCYLSANVHNQVNIIIEDNWQINCVRFLGLAKLVSCVQHSFFKHRVEDICPS